MSDDGFHHTVLLDTPEQQVYWLAAQRVGAEVEAHSHAIAHVAHVLRGRFQVALRSPDGVTRETFEAGAGHRAVFDVPARWAHRMVALELPAEITCTFAKRGAGDPKEPGRLDPGTMLEAI